MKFPDWKSFLIVLVLLACGMVLGSAGMLALLYEKPGKKLVWKLDRMMEARLGKPRDQGQTEERSWKVANGLKVEPHAIGFDFPVRIAFPKSASVERSGVFYYVAELGGAIKAVGKDGRVAVVASNLLNFQRTAEMELGLLGLAYDEPENQFFVTMSYEDMAAGVYRNKVERLTCSPDGLSITDRQIILDMRNEDTVASYQIQFSALGPDGYLYVGVGSGGRKEDAQSQEKFAGKVIRMNKDGRAVETNPFFDASEPSLPKSYIYAYGFRNPFDIVWHPQSGVAIVSDVGPGIDRIVRLEPGVNYAFRDDENQMRANALYTWGPGTGYAPVGLTFVTDGVLGEPHEGKLLAGLFGPVHQPGPNEGKRLCQFEFDLRGYLLSHARDFVHYEGSRFASVVDVKTGPDGVYFTDFYGESLEPHFGGGVVFRIVEDPNWVATESVRSTLQGYELGKLVFAESRCLSCHVLDAEGGKEGPALDHLRSNLTKRLLARSYDEWLRDLSKKEGAYFVKHRGDYHELLGVSGDKRLRAWLRHHLHDPRFDNPSAKMPQQDFLKGDEVEALTTFLLKQ